jgi:uncharacterized protein DUF3551
MWPMSKKPVCWRSKMQMTPKTPLAHLYRVTIVAAGILSLALIASLPAPAVAQAVSYPWCTSDEEVHCYYTTQQQCEEAVDYHGFCIMNPDYRASSGAAPRRAH